MSNLSMFLVSILAIKPWRLGFLLAVLLVSTFGADTIIQCEGKSVFSWADLHMQVRCSDAIFMLWRTTQGPFAKFLTLDGSAF